MKKISLLVVLAMIFTVTLIAQESDPSEIVGYVAYNCVEGTIADNNFISVPLYMVDAEGDTLRTLNSLGDSFIPEGEDTPTVNAISFWVAETQSWDGISWDEDGNRWLGNPGDDDLFPLEYGHSYMISITEELTFYSVGGLPEPVQYTLELGTTGDNNFIMVPLDRADLTTLNSVGDDISANQEYANAVSFWIAETQSWDGISWDAANNRWMGNPGDDDLFPAVIGMPLMVSVTEEIGWPHNGRAESRRRIIDRRMR